MTLEVMSQLQNANVVTPEVHNSNVVTPGYKCHDSNAEKTINARKLLFQTVFKPISP